MKIPHYMVENKLPHIENIPTLRRTIKWECFNKSYGIVKTLLKCIVCDEHEDTDYIANVLLVASCLEHLSRYVYNGTSGEYKKPTATQYKHMIFEGYAEFPEEVSDHLNSLGFSEFCSETAYIKLWKIADFVCTMMACPDELGFVYEYAAAIDYIISHDITLPKPEIRVLFPSNYPDFNRYIVIWEDKVKNYELLYSGHF